MRKYLVKTLLLVCALIFFSMNSVKASSISSSETNIKNTIYSYFDNELQSVKDFKIHDSKNLICNDDLEEYSKTKNNYYSEWYKGINYKLNSYDIKIAYTNFNINNNIANVTVENNLTMIFDEDSNIKQQQVLKYIFILKNINGQWKIHDVIDLNDDDNYNNSTIQELGLTANYDNKINYKELTKQFSNVQADLNAKKNQDKVDKEQSQLSSYKTSGSGAGAAAYAEEWAHRRNPRFHNCDKDGGDCTNFVSQCLNYGGVPQTSYWWGNANGCSTYWCAVIPLYNWLINGGVGYESNRYICKPGDVLQFYNSYFQTWHHSALVVKKIGNRVYFTAHSKDVNDQNLDNVYPGQYPNCRVIGVRY